MTSIIFDLDQTLLDTSLAEVHRNSRRWQSAYDEIPNFKTYMGMDEIFEHINEKGMKSCIVTNSPSSYCSKVVSHWKIVCDFHICFHDTKNRKPHADPYLLAIERFSEAPEKVLAVGDRDIDIIAAHAAGIKSVACLWGANETASLLAADPTYTAKTPHELLEIIKTFDN